MSSSSVSDTPLLRWTTVSLLMAITLLPASVVVAADQISKSVPLIVEHPSDLIVLRNEPATLNCRADGEPPPIITWFKNGGERVATADDNPTSHRMLLPGGQLFFLRVMSSSKSSSSSSHTDAGVYYCRATNPVTGESDTSRNATLTVASIREDFREEPPASIESSPGETVLLPCRPPRGDPEPMVRWRKDGVDVVLPNVGGTSSRVRLAEDGASLKLVDIGKEDAGKYTCVAQNIAGERESRAAELHVIEKPRILHGPSDAVVQENGEVLFKCHATGDPEPATIWKKRKGLISAQRARILDDRSLRIKKVKISDEGIYVCRIENKLGWQEAEARLTITSQPTFLTIPTSKSVVAGRRVSFDCQTSGLPVPAIFWRKDNDETTVLSVGEKYGRYYVNDGGTLVIERTLQDDSGEWTCLARSSAGSAYAKARLDVKETDARPPPVIQHGPQNQTLPVGSMALLRCVVSGGNSASSVADLAPASVRWLKDSNLLATDEHRLKIVDQGSLQIGDLRRTDTGLYTCRASSETGETTHSAALIVEPPTDPDVIFHRTPDPSTFPGQPSKPNVADIKETSVRLSWKPNPNNGASIVSGFTIEYFSIETGEGWTVAADNVPDNSYIVRGLRSDTGYRFVVRARNSHGLSLPSPVTSVIRTKVSKTEQPASKLPSPGDIEDELSTGNAKAWSSMGAEMVRLMPPDSMGPTSAQIRWDIRRNSAVSNSAAIRQSGVSGGSFGTALEGFRIKYRPMSDAEIGSLLQTATQSDTSLLSPLSRPNLVDGRPSSVDAGGGKAGYSMQTVLGADRRSYLLDGLLASTIYSVVVHPFYGPNSVEGSASNVVYLQTSDDVPSASPHKVLASMLENGTISLTWEPPPKQTSNGPALTGYKVYVRSNETQFYRTYWINSTHSSLYQLSIPIHDRRSTHSIEIAAHNKIGEGPRSLPAYVGPYEDDRGSASSGNSDVPSYEPWLVAVIVACVGSALWMAMCTLVMWLYRWRRRKQLSNLNDIDKNAYGISSDSFYRSIPGLLDRNGSNKRGTQVTVSTAESKTFSPVMKSDQLYRFSDNSSTDDGTHKVKAMKSSMEFEHIYSNNDTAKSGSAGGGGGAVHGGHRLYDEPNAAYTFRPVSLYRSTRVFLPPPPPTTATPQSDGLSSWNYYHQLSPSNEYQSNYDDDLLYNRFESVSQTEANEMQQHAEVGRSFGNGGQTVSVLRPGDYTLGRARRSQQTR